MAGTLDVPVIVRQSTTEDGEGDASAFGTDPKEMKAMAIRLSSENDDAQILLRTMMRHIAKIPKMTNEYFFDSGELAYGGGVS